jgi:hypothetical protein
VLQDPLADGVTIHTAATRALQKGTTLDKVIDMVAKVSPTLTAPLVLFTYYNPIIRRGMDKFCQQIKEAGAAGGGSTDMQETADGHERSSGQICAAFLQQASQQRSNSSRHAGAAHTLLCLQPRSSSDVGSHTLLVLTCAVLCFAALSLSPVHRPAGA